MIPLQDQFDMGRIPVRPIPYQSKDLAYTHELIVDSIGEKPTYHIYITSAEDSSKLIDLSAALIQEGFNSKDLTVMITGVNDPVSIHDVLEYIYLRFVHIDDIAGFDPSKDMEKVLNSDNKNVMLKDINGSAVFPVVRAENVFDKDGVSIQDKFNTITRLAITRDAIHIDTEQSTINTVYPFNDYRVNGNYMELRIDGTYISPEQYEAIENMHSDGITYGCSIQLHGDTFKANQNVEVVYFYNASGSAQNSVVIDGAMIANKSIPISKLQYSNSFIHDDPNSLATSRALYNLYNSLYDTIAAQGSHSIYAKDLANNDPNTISINLVNDDVTLDSNYVMVTVYIASGKYEDVTVMVHHKPDRVHVERKEFMCEIPNGIGAGRMLRLLINQDECIVLNAPEVHLARERYIHYSQTPETLISFAGLELYQDSILTVHRNGIRLFEDIDYSINYTTQTIKLFTRTATKDVIVFEAQHIAF